MMTLLALIVTGSIGSLLLWLVGVLIVGAIVYAIMRVLDCPPGAFKVLYVIGLIVLLLVAIDFFFGGATSGDRVIIRQ